MELSVTAAIVFFGSGISVLLGLEQITGRKAPGISNVLLFCVSLCVSVILSNHVFLSAGFSALHPWLTNYH